MIPILFLEGLPNKIIKWGVWVVFTKICYGNRKEKYTQKYRCCKNRRMLEEIDSVQSKKAKYDQEYIGLKRANLLSQY